jgi:hypothetical protein
VYSTVHTNTTCTNGGGGPASQHTASWLADFIILLFILKFSMR